MHGSRMLRFIATLAIGMVFAGVARAQLSAGGLQGSPGLGDAKLKPAKLQTTKLQPSRVQSTQLETSKLQPVRKQLNPAAIAKTAVNLVRGGVTPDKVQGAATSIPPSQIGALLFGVAKQLEQLDLEQPEVDLSDLAIGYYMAVLADPAGKRFADAQQRLRDIFLDDDLSREEALRLYAGGLSTMKSLYELKIGLTREGFASGMRELNEISLAYAAKRASKEPDSKEPDSAEDK